MIIYNPDKFKENGFTAPRSPADLRHPKLAGRVMISDISSGGSIRQYQLRLANGQTLLSEARAGDRTWPIGDTVLLGWEPQHAVLVADTAPTFNLGESP